MTEPFVLVDVSSWVVADNESGGGEEKVWLTAPDGDEWLFKPRTEHEGWAQGEDWAERIATELALRLDIPTANANLAVRNGRLGSISRSLVASGWELQPGALLLTEIVPGFITHEKARTGHNLVNIARVLDGVDPPTGYEAMTAFDVFVGYLVLDALVANQDRHEENWAVLRPLVTDGSPVLASSYDHGSSLGFNLLDKKRATCLANGTVETFAGKGWAQRFERATDERLSLVELTERALAMAAAPARARWIAAVDALTDEVLQNTVDRVPDMSDPARRFTLKMLTTNRRRLLHDH